MKKVLLPFESLSRLDLSLDSALDLADTMSAEVILLRVNPLADRLAATSSDCLYAELKALQARLADCKVPVTIETMPGSASEAIASYSDWAGDDCVVLDLLAPTVAAADYNRARVT